MGTQIARSISVYRKSGDEELRRYRLRGVPIGLLHELFGESRENPMYDVYPIDYAKLIALRKFVVPGVESVKLHPNTSRYDYFLEADVEPTPYLMIERERISRMMHARKTSKPVVPLGSREN